MQLLRVPVTVLKLIQVQSVPANTGVLLEGNEGTYEIPVVASSETDVTAKELVGVLEDTPVDGGFLCDKVKKELQKSRRVPTFSYFCVSIANFIFTDDYERNSSCWWFRYSALPYHEGSEQAAHPYF